MIKEDKIVKTMKIVAYLGAIFWAWVIGIYMGHHVESNFWKNDAGIEFEAGDRSYSILSPRGANDIQIVDLDRNGSKYIKIIKK